MPFTVYPCPEFSAFLGFGPVKGPSKEVLVATHDVPYHGVETVARVLDSECLLETVCTPSLVKEAAENGIRTHD